MRISRLLLSVVSLMVCAGPVRAGDLTFVGSTARVEAAAGAFYVDFLNPANDDSDSDSESVVHTDVMSFDDMASAAAGTFASSGDAEATLVASFSGNSIIAEGSAGASASGGIGAMEEAYGDGIGDALFEVVFSVPHAVDYQLDVTLAGFGSGGGGFDGGAYYSLREVGGGLLFAEEVRRFEEDSRVFMLMGTLAPNDYVLRVGAQAVASVSEFDNSGHAQLDFDFSMNFVPEPAACAMVALSFAALAGCPIRRRGSG